MSEIRTYEIDGKSYQGFLQLVLDLDSEKTLMSLPRYSHQHSFICFCWF